MGDAAEVLSSSKGWADLRQSSFYARVYLQDPKSKRMVYEAPWYHG